MSMPCPPEAVGKAELRSAETLGQGQASAVELGPYEKYAEGIYWTINPVSPGHLANYGSKLERRKKGTTTDHDVVARYWLPLDADATRLDPVTGASIKVVYSTDAEKATASCMEK